MRKIPFSQQDIEYMIQQYNLRAMSTTELGKHFNCSASTISRTLKKNNIVLKQVYKSEDLTGKKFGLLTVVQEDTVRYQQERLRTNKPHKYWFCKCGCGNNQLISVESSHLKNGHTTSCGCIKSLAEQKIVALLQKHDIPFITEYSFSDLRGAKQGVLRYDFAIFDSKQNLQYLIEYNGKQHYVQNGGWNTVEEFQTRLNNDQLKIEYAHKNNIPLIIIPYTVAPASITIEHITLSKEDGNNAYLA